MEIVDVGPHAMLSSWAASDAYRFNTDHHLLFLEGVPG